MLSLCMQWLPHKWQFQVLFLIYRWIFALYFLGWLIHSGVQTGGPKFFIFLTIWSLLMWVAYLLFAAASVTLRFFQVHIVCRQKFEIDLALVDSDPAVIEKPKGCCGAKTDRITWYQKIQWFLFNIGTESAFIVLLLYWSLLYRGGPISGATANSDLTNGLIALVDVWLSGTPVQFLHFIYLQACGIMYAVFTGIYYVADGTNTRGDPYIYPVLNYGNNTALAVGLDIGVVLVLAPAIHVLWYFMYAARFWLVWFIYRKCRQAYTVAVEEQPMTVKQASTVENQALDVEMS